MQQRRLVYQSCRVLQGSPQQPQPRIAVRPKAPPLQASGLQAACVLWASLVAEQRYA